MQNGGMYMKITDVKVIPVNRFLFVEVHTDEGIIGVGESGTWGFLDASGEVVKSFRSYLIGQDPLKIEHHWQYMYRCFHFRGAAIMGAISGILQVNIIILLFIIYWVASAGIRQECIIM